MIIDLSKEIETDNKVDVKFGDRVWSIAFDDEFRKKIELLATQVQKEFNKTDDEDYREKLISATKASQKKMLTTDYADLKKVMVDGLDDVLGEGAGEYLYEAYGNSTERLGAIIQLLDRSANQKLDSDRRAQKTAKYNVDR